MASQSAWWFDEAYDVAHLDAPGVRFVPTDAELITYYLERRLRGARLPCNVVQDFDVYSTHPSQLGSAVAMAGDNWYVFSRRERKYPNGKRPRRGTGSGYWKATGAREPITDGSGEGAAQIGHKRALSYLEGSQKDNTKTPWKMVEFVSDDSEMPAGATDSMLLNDWVLCKVSYKEESTANARDRKFYCGEAARKKSTEKSCLSSDPLRNSRNHTTALDMQPEEELDSQQQMVSDFTRHQSNGLDHHPLQPLAASYNYRFPEIPNSGFLCRDSHNHTIALVMQSEEESGSEQQMVPDFMRPQYDGLDRHSLQPLTVSSNYRSPEIPNLGFLPRDSRNHITALDMQPEEKSGSEQQMVPDFVHHQYDGLDHHPLQPLAASYNYGIPEISNSDFLPRDSHNHTTILDM